MAEKSIENQQNLTSTLPKVLPINFLNEITNNFTSEILGSSVFGTVYKGTLPEGGVIAVKMLSDNSPVAHGIIFATEVTNLMAHQHKNIVELVGSSCATQQKVKLHNGRYVIVDMTEKFLCYKYLPLGTLDKHLDDEAKTIDWNTRFNIIKGICQGLHFLHIEAGPLIHMNLLPSSIWLDNDWVPKIADFGLARLFGQEQTRMNTINVMGKNGYMAPEYLYRGEISSKSDIYSLGMLIIEITTGEKNNADVEDRCARKFVEKVFENWKTDVQITRKYPSLDPNGFQAVKLCILIGLKCVDADRDKRPSIVDIVNKLGGKRVKIFDEEPSLQHGAP
ncbi:hypothetical protein QOZ80_3BG0272570 [Eleusine coracana subsp. coracana]|nr:hypothetical protein QOZ80_3BG0272570 [Eleusine coracana subsp. coracana]